MALVVKNTFIHWGAGNEHPIHVLAGSPTDAVPGQKRIRMVSDTAFAEGTIARAYSEEFGILIGLDNLREKRDTEIDIYDGWQLHEDADGAWAVRDPMDCILRAPRADALYELIDAYEEPET